MNSASSPCWSWWVAVVSDGCAGAREWGAMGQNARDYRVITTTRPRESLGGGAWVEAGGYRTRTSALTGGGASTGVATSVMALGSRRGGVSPGDVSPGEKPLTSRVPEHVVFAKTRSCQLQEKALSEVTVRGNLFHSAARQTTTCRWLMDRCSHGLLGRRQGPGCTSGTDKVRAPST